jgi:hypothetical protein
VLSTATDKASSQAADGLEHARTAVDKATKQATKQASKQAHKQAHKVQKKASATKDAAVDTARDNRAPILVGLIALAVLGALMAVLARGFGSQ